MTLRRFDNVLAIILGGGKGTRLYPLTQERCKPAISFGGKYRLIDIPMSNCLNSGISKIFILTQFLTASLHRHIFQTYHLDMLSRGFIEILPAEQTLTGEHWYHGNADAVRQSVRYITNQPINDVLILSGDQMCRMDFGAMMAFHRKSNAGLTVITNKVPKEEAYRMGIIKTDRESGKVTELCEKPQDISAIKGYEDKDGNYWASTGNYIFNRDVLLKVLSESEEEDFGKQVIPRTINEADVYAYPFEGYWEDIGTIRSFFDANIDLASPLPKFNLYDEQHPIYTHARSLPAAKVQDSEIHESLISEGSLIASAKISNAVIGVRSVIQEGSTIKNSILLGNDFYSQSFGKQKVTPHVGKKVTIERAIIDKNVTIGNQSKIIGSKDPINLDNSLYCVRDGIVVIPKGSTIPPGTVIKP